VPVLRPGGRCSRGARPSTALACGDQPALRRSGHSRKATEIDTDRKIAIAVMWGFLVVLGPPGLVLTSLNDPSHLPLALTVIVGGTVAAAATTWFVRHSARRSQGRER